MKNLICQILSFNPLCVGNPGPVKLSGTRKVIQLTGDMDRETRHITPNQTGKNFGIYGTDLGVSFLHDGKLYFLFGDTLLGLPVVAWRIPVFEELYSQHIGHLCIGSVASGLRKLSRNSKYFLWSSV